MPIYAYRCADCGHTKDVLQKLSDPVLTTCPACGKESFAKQLTAAGFQLKGSGWYVTDFRGGAGGAGSKAQTDAKSEPTKSESKSESAKSDSTTASAGGGDSTAGGCGSSCACH